MGLYDHLFDTVLKEQEPNFWVGNSDLLMKLDPVGEVLRALARPNINIDLLEYDITVVGVYTKPRPRGFDFRCKQVERLMMTMVTKSLRAKLPQGPYDFESDKDKKQPVFNEDKGDTREGSFSAGETKGRGFRQIGTGAALHVEIQPNGMCNAHIDSHGYVLGPDQYDWGNNGLQHGYWNLLADKVPGMFGSFGRNGEIGVMIRPMRGVDDRNRWVIGVTGNW